MKKILFILLAFVSLAANAQTSFGKMTVFPNKKMMGIAYKPQLGFCKAGDETLLVLRYTESSGYASFDEDCKLLFRTDDDSLHRAPLYTQTEIQKDYSTSWNSLLKCYNHFYTTYSFYSIPETLLSDILNGSHNIIKIRVSFTNGNVADYDITESYGKKLSEGLRESYSTASARNEERKQNMKNDDEGF